MLAKKEKTFCASVLFQSTRNTNHKMMLRSIKNIRNYKSIVRDFSSTQFEVEYKNAKPFSEIPGIKSPFQGN